MCDCGCFVRMYEWELVQMRQCLCGHRLVFRVSVRGPFSSVLAAYVLPSAGRIYVCSFTK